MSADAAWEDQRCPTCGRYPAVVRPDCPPACPSRSESQQLEANDAAAVAPSVAPGPEEPATDAASVADTPAQASSDQPGLVDRIEAAVDRTLEGFRGNG